MNIKQIFLCAIVVISGSAICTKSQVVQSDIFYEIKKGNARAVKAWLKTSPDLSVKNKYGQTLLGCAVVHKKSNITKLLIKAGVNINQVDGAGKTALDFAVSDKQRSMALVLLEKGAKLGSAVYLHDLNVLVKKQRSSFGKLFIGVVGTVFLFAGIIYLGCALVAPLLPWLWCTGCMTMSQAMGSAVMCTVIGTGCVIGAVSTYHSIHRPALKVYDFDMHTCLVRV